MTDHVAWEDTPLGRLSTPPRVAGVAEPGPTRIVAVAGGKGGIGKSAIAVTLGVELARRGLRTILVDLDFGGPNLHTLLGMSHPRETVSEFVSRRVETLAGLAVPTPVPALSLVPGARNAVQDASLLHQQKNRLLRALAALQAPVVLLDLGAGTHHNVVDFFLAATHGILVVVPEPTSVENTYRFLKAAFLRRLKQAGLDDAVKALIAEAARDGARSPAELVAAVERSDPQAGAALRRLGGSFRPLLVVNQARSSQELALVESMPAAAERLFGVAVAPLGVVHHCELLGRAVRSRLPLVPENLGRELTADVGALASSLLALPARGGGA